MAIQVELSEFGEFVQEKLLREITTGETLAILDENEKVIALVERIIEDTQDE